MNKSEIEKSQFTKRHTRWKMKNDGRDQLQFKFYNPPKVTNLNNQILARLSVEK